MKRPTKRQICLGVAIVGIIFLLVYELICKKLVCNALNDADLCYLIDMAITRFVGGAVFFAMVINLEYRVIDPFRAPFWKALLFSLPAFVVAINNFPFSQIIRGGAVIDAPWWRVALLFFECLCVGFFEEMAFRGVVFLGVLRKKRTSRAWAFASIMISAAAFGLIHLINLFHSSPVAVLMQIGYSFLIGAMCSVVLLKTANIWLCVILHGIFNFCGAIIEHCGHGSLWDTFTIVITVIISVAVTVYMVIAFLRLDLSVIASTYERKRLHDTNADDEHS